MKYTQKWYAEVTDEAGKTHTFPATVPGNIQKDYADYIGITDIMYANNVSALEKTEPWTWTYHTDLDYTASPGERIVFVAEGIDYIWDISLDGETLLSGEGMYTPVRLDLTDRITPHSRLSVVIHPHPKNGTIVRDRAEAADTCKPPFCYGWDWNPRLLVSGLWREAYIETIPASPIRSCELFYDLDAKERTAEVHFACDCDGEVTYTVYDADGNTAYCGTDSHFTLTDLHLWWCNGLGEAYLYRWEARSATDIKSGTVGFRTARLVQNAGTEHEPLDFPKGQYPAPITVELNGVRVFAKGSNIVSIGLFPGCVTEAEYEYVVSSVAEANMNIVRIWGGSGILKPSFYDLCDRYGIMVWQEFMLACNLYTDDPHYMTILRREAASIVRLLRPHPSLIFWCGGNELFNDWSGMTEQSLPLRLLNAVCLEEDPKRAFLPTSPVSGMAHGGYVFRDDDGNELFRIFQTSRRTAYTEFGCPSLASAETLRKIIPESELFPITPTESWTVHHAFDSWGVRRWACLDVIEYYFGRQSDLDSYVRLSQRLQCFGYQNAFEEARRQWGVCSMAINWCFNEPWITAANNSLISYPNVRKIAYESVKKALRPKMASARIPKYSWTSGEKLGFEVWYHNETLSNVSDKVTLKIILGDSVIYTSKWETGEIAPMTNRKGLAVSFDLPDHAEKEFLRIVLETDDPEASNEYEILFETPVSKGRTMNI